MTPDEYQRLKEAEKEHLRKLKELKTAVRQLERQQRVSHAVENITESPRTLLDRTSDLVDQLALETARSEAKLDIALETAAEKDAENPTRTAAEQDALYDEDLRKARARQLLQQLRDEVGGPTTSSRAPNESTHASRSSPAPSATGGPSNPAQDTKSLPEKTIGRMKP